MWRLDLRLSFLRALIGTRWEYYLSQPMGTLANSAASEVMRASNSYLHGSLATIYMVQSLVYAIVALMVSWQASISAFFAGSILIFFLNRLVRKTKRAGRRETELMQSLIARLTDTLQSVKPLKSMGREELSEKLLEADAVRLNQALRKQVYSQAMLKSLQEPILMFLVVATLYLTLFLWKLELPTVMILVFLLARLLGEQGKMQRKFQEMAACESAFWSLRNKIDEAVRQKEPNPGKLPAHLNKSLRFNNVSFSYSGVAVFENLSFEIQSGSFTAVTGHSGGGKTTLVDLVIGLLRPKSGEILLDGTSLGDIDIKTWRSKIGYVPQDNVLLHDTIMANVTLYDPTLNAQEAEDALRSAGAWDFVSAMPEGLQTIAGERGSKLSGGQRQRIAIARALAHKPDMLILDEATSALDPENEHAICKTLSELRGRMTILAISHQPAIVEVADTVFVVHDGNISSEKARDKILSEHLNRKGET